MFNTYGAPETSQDRDQLQEHLLSQIKKKGPSYSQLQKKKRKPKKKLEKRKQTFYEKVLSKTIGAPLAQNYEGTRYTDPMNKTTNLKNISAHVPEPHYHNGNK